MSLKGEDAFHLVFVCASRTSLSFILLLVATSLDINL